MSKGSILAIDDDSFFCRLYEEVLVPEGFLVRTAESGKQALELIKEQRFDVVITDMLMPGWDGIRTMQEIKKTVPDQEVVIVTHVTDLETAVEAMKSGAADYIMKPIKNEDLLYSIRRLLKRQRILVEHSKLIKENIEYFEILSTYKKCLDILSINDYLHLVDAIVDAMMVEAGAKKGLFWVSDGGVEGGWEVAGTASEIVQRDAALPSGDPLWKEKVKSGIPFFWPEERGNIFFVPILLSMGRLGVVEVCDKRGHRHFDDSDLKVAGILAEFSQVALNNAKKLSKLEEYSYKNEEYDVYTYSFFKDYLQKQVYVSSRYHRPFSVICLKIDNIKDIVSYFSGSVVLNGTKQLLDKVIGVLRDSDVIAYRGDGLFYMLLTETDYFGSIMAIQRIEEGLTGLKYISDGERSMQLELHIMSASYPRDGSGMESIIDNVTAKTATVAESLFKQLDLSDSGFWDSVNSMLDNKKGFQGKAGVGSYVYHDFSSRFYSDLTGFFADEVLLRPFLRGVLFIGADTVTPDMEFCKKLASAEKLATRVFIVGKKGKGEWNIPNITPVYLKKDEEPMNMILFLNEEAGYTFLGKKGKGDTLNSLHTSDIYLVEKLITKLRNHYLLQWI